MSKMILNNKILEILSEFSFDYNGRIYGREITRKLKMNQKTISNFLNKLEKDNILKFHKEGKNKYYFLNKFNSQIKEIIKMIEINRKIEFIERHEKLKDLLEKIEDRSKGIVIIFGSFAKGTANKNSDLDVFIIGNISEIDDLEKIYNLKINIVKSTKEKFNKQDLFIKEIIKNHIILKGVEEFVELIW